MTEQQATPTAGAIHDIGYRHYDGPRLGPAYIQRSLYLDTFLGAFGLGRSARSKVMPVILLVIMLLPALIMSFVTNYFGADELPVRYTEYAFALQVAVTIFVGAQSPAAMSRDLRFRVAPLYFSRPLSRRQYVQAKLAAVASALFVFMVLPLLVLFLGALLAELPLDENVPDLLRAIAGAAILAVVLAAIGLALSSMTPRRGFGVAAVVAVLLVTSAVQGIVRALLEEFSSDRAAGYAGLISPFTLVDGIIAGPLRGVSVMETPPDGVLASTVFSLVAVAVVAGGYAFLVARYRKALS